jgi:hypothetical protein
MKFFILICVVSLASAVELEEKIQKKRSIYGGIYGASLPSTSISSHTHTHSTSVIERPVAVPVPVKTPSIYSTGLNYGSYGYPSTYTPSYKFDSLSYPTTYSSLYPSYKSYSGALSYPSYPSVAKFGSIAPSYNYGYGYNYPTYASAKTISLNRGLYPSISTYPSIYRKSYYSTPLVSKW